MTRYLISFDDGAMTFPEEDLPDVAQAARAVVAFGCLAAGCIRTTRGPRLGSEDRRRLPFVRRRFASSCPALRADQAVREKAAKAFASRCSPTIAWQRSRSGMPPERGDSTDPHSRSPDRPRGSTARSVPIPLIRRRSLVSPSNVCVHCVKPPSPSSTSPR